jgi:hypothetical protein
MNVLHAISDLPQAPGVYAMYGGKGRGRYVAYVGIAQKLRDRIVQHLVRRDSSVATGTSAVQLNPDYVTAVEWWGHPDFDQRHVLEAAEMVAFDVLDPALRSRGAPQEKARDLYADEAFREKMHALFSGEPAGQLVIRTLEDAFERMAELEERIKDLERERGTTHAPNGPIPLTTVPNRRKRNRQVSGSWFLSFGPLAPCQVRFSESVT